MWLTINSWDSRLVDSVYYIIFSDISNLILVSDSHTMFEPIILKPLVEIIL